MQFAFTRTQRAYLSYFVLLFFCLSLPLAYIILHLAVTSVCPYKEFLSSAPHQTHFKLYDTLLSQLNLRQKNESERRTD